MSSEQTAAAGSRNSNLDILRILAAFMVLMVHVGYAFPWIADYTWTGYYGVTLFYSLSGYLSMVSMERSGSVIEFYKKRILRIIPLYWSILIISYILQLVTNLPKQGLSVFSLNGPCSVRYLRYFFFLNMFIPSDSFDIWNNMNGFWTMPAFVFFYLTVPLLYKLIRRFYAALPVLVVLLFGRELFGKWLEDLLNRSVPRIDGADVFAQWMPLSVFYCFFLGVTVYYAVKDSQAFLFALLAVMSLIYNEFKWFAWDIAMALLLLLAVTLPPLLKKEGRLKKGVQTFSAFSFALYLTHIMTLEYVMRLKKVLVPIIRNKGFLLFAIAVCIGVGYVIWRFVAGPVERLFVRRKNSAVSG
ncbi:MAG: acyltransferase [Lachnospiraceae bacterium]|nr:acyltransferase [Lachnospiraceae bacterium]